MTSRPNFVLFITDQQRADYLGCYGHPQLRAPNIDRIAANGVRFTRFYVANPVCMPNRATLMTGRMSSNHGVRSNGIPLSLQANTFVDLLRRAGYRTGLVGKSHLQNFTGLPPLSGTDAVLPGPPEMREALVPFAASSRYSQESAGFWSREDAKVEVPFYGFEHTDLCTGHGDRVGGAYLRWARERGVEVEQLRGPDRALESDYRCPQSWRTAVPEEVYPTSFVEDRALSFLDGHAGADGNRPFFLKVSFPDPHHPFTPPGRYWDLYDPASVALPASFDTRPRTRRLEWIDELNRDSAFDRQRSMVFVRGTEREVREAIALSCGMIAMIDDAVGRILGRLTQLGLASNTVVAFTSDHGDFLGDHGLLFKGGLHYRSVIRVPFIWQDPARGGGARVSEAVSGTLDIARTVLERAGVVPYHGIQGRSLAPEIERGEDGGPGDVLIEEEQQRRLFGSAWPTLINTLVTGRYRLSVYRGSPDGELYDLVEDPHELVNLWHEPLHQRVRHELVERMLQRKLDLGDPSPRASALA